MKFWKHSAITAVVFLSIVSTVTYTSCIHDSCKALMCRNDGVCVDGFCNCELGYLGTQCEIIARQKFVGSYAGQTEVVGMPVVRDSATVKVSGINGDVNATTLESVIFSRLPEVIHGAVNAEGDEVIVADENGKNITFKWLGNNQIEILIIEENDGQRVITNFKGTKYK